MKSSTNTANIITMITGSNRGIGLALTRLALEKGHRTLATCRRKEEAEKLNELKVKYSSQLSIHSLDVSSDSSVKSCFQEINEMKIDHIDIMFSNAGIYGENQDKFSNLSVEKMMETFQVNTFGQIRVLKEGIRLLKKSSLGKLIGITSRMGSIEDNQSGGSYDYRMSKSAMNMLYKNLSREFPELLSLVLHPGWAKTKMGGPNALITPEESAMGIFSVVEKSTLRQSGKFMDYQGKEIPW